MAEIILVYIVPKDIFLMSVFSYAFLLLISFSVHYLAIISPHEFTVNCR